MFQMHESKGRSGLQKAGVKITKNHKLGQVHSSGCSTDLTENALSGNSVFFALQVLRVLRVFCAEFQMWRCPALPICHPKAQLICNSEF